jgi:methylphosphotriester-DNA--protein-cysteine methyltransferase
MKKEEFERRCREMRETNSKASAAVSGAALADEPDKPLSVKQAAQRLGRSEWWTRKHFKKVFGAYVIPGSGKRGKRQYETVTVPVDVFERELLKFRVK